MMGECEFEPKVNSCVGDEDQLEVECWNCSFRWCIFRFYAADTSAKCPNCGMWNKKALRDALRDTEVIEAYLNSPQFRKTYTSWKKCESIRDTARQDGIAFGQQNPEPKQFVDREKLVEELLKLRQYAIDFPPKEKIDNYLMGLTDAIQTIRKHGQEEG